MRIVQARWFRIKEKDGTFGEVIFSDSTIRNALKRLYKKHINILLPNKTSLKIGPFDHPPIKTLFFVNSPYINLNYINTLIVHPLDFNVKDLTGNELSELNLLNHALHVRFFFDVNRDHSVIYNYYEGFNINKKGSNC